MGSNRFKRLNREITTSAKYNLVRRLAHITTILIVAELILTGNVSSKNITEEGKASSYRIRISPSAINIIYLPTILNSNNFVTSSSDWPMLAANPQKTSWNTEEIKADFIRQMVLADWTLYPNKHPAKCSQWKDLYLNRPSLRYLEFGGFQDSR
jgi:hypothetical protein